MKRLVMLGMLGLLTIFAGLVAHACPLCLGGVAFGPGQQMDVAQQAVIATPTADGKGWRVLEIVKGRAIAGQVITGPVDGADGAAMRTLSPLLLLHREEWPRWTSVGTIDVKYARWLRQLAATGPRMDRSDVDWRGRVALVSPYLENAESLAALIAYGEIARAPYGALRPLKPRLDAATITRWLDDPKLVSRRPAYTLLLGIAGSRQDAARLEQRLEAAWASRDATNLSSMLAADLELRGPSRVPWIETMYLTDRRRTMPEIIAAIQALREHGNENGAVPRTRVIQAYVVLIKEHKPMAGLVAADLAEWEYWDAVAEYGALLTSNVPLDPTSRGEIVAYLKRCPRSEAKAALASLPDVPVGSPDPASRLRWRIPDLKVIR